MGIFLTVLAKAKFFYLSVWFLLVENNQINNSQGALGGIILYGHAEWVEPRAD